LIQEGDEGLGDFVQQPGGLLRVRHLEFPDGSHARHRRLFDRLTILFVEREAQ
jgi:hypothetical protein